MFKNPHKIKRASSGLSYFISTKEEALSLLDKIWQTMSIKQQIESLLAYHDENGRGILILAVRHNDYDLIE